MATKLAHKRLTKEYQAMQKEPPPFIYARFDEKNILDWHFIIAGPPDSPYAGGQYHGLIMFPSEYPFKPPDIKFFTPSGRFAPGEKICFSMTSFHPSTITTGGIRTTDEEKRRLAKASHQFNISNKKFKEIFPEYAGPTPKDLPDMGPKPSAPSTPDTGKRSPAPEPSSASKSVAEVQKTPTPPTAASSIKLKIEFGGGLHLLFNSQPKHQIALPIPSEGPADMRHLIKWMKDNLLSDVQRSDMFGDGEGVRPGILVLINDVDWELEGELDCIVSEGDEVVFISTLHGG